MIPDSTEKAEDIISLKTVTLSALPLLLAFGLGGCAQPAPAPVGEPSKEAYGLMRHVNLCFDNATSGTITIAWYKGENGTDTFSGEGDLAPGKAFCGEGSAMRATLGLADGFRSNVVAVNRPAEYPAVSFEGLDGAQEFDKALGYTIYTGTTLASAHYSQGETVGSDLEGHAVSVTRGADNDWINFSVTVSG